MTNDNTLPLSPTTNQEKAKTKQPLTRPISPPLAPKLGDADRSRSRSRARGRAKDRHPLTSWLSDLAKRKEQAKVREIVDFVVDAHATLVKLPNLSPGEVTNKTLEGLVNLCCGTYDGETVREVLKNSRLRRVLPSLRAICSASESCLENYWASQICNGDDADAALETLKSFPYFQNYVDLARLELYTLYAVQPRLPTKIAFLGSGPLPLTSLCLLRALKDFHGAVPEPCSCPSVLNVDQDADALQASQALCEKLGHWSQGMEFRCADAAKAIDLTEFEVVFLAALVGVGQVEKESIMAKLAKQMRSGALLVARSAHGLRTLLYPEVDLATEGLRDVLQVETVTHPYGDVVNSVIIARVKGSPQSSSQ